MNICFYGRCFKPYVSSSLPKGMRKFYKKYGLEPITPYGLRHSFCSACSKQKLTPVTTMSITGHSSYQSLVDNYFRVLPEEKEEAMEELTNALFTTKNAI